MHTYMYLFAYIHVFLSIYVCIHMHVCIAICMYNLQSKKQRENQKRYHLCTCIMCVHVLSGTNHGSPVKGGSTETGYHLMAFSSDQNSSPGISSNSLAT